MPLTVEDLLAGLVQCSGFPWSATALWSEWDVSFICNVNDHVQRGRALSTEQSRIVLKLAASYRDTLLQNSVFTQADFDSALANPVYRRRPQLSARIPREVRYLGSNLLAFRFKFDEILIREFKLIGERSFGTKPHFDRHSRIWIVPVTRVSLRSVQRIIQTFRFDTDTAVRDYLNLAKSSLNQSSGMIVDAETGAVFGNICDNDLLSLWIVNVAGGMHV